MRLSSTCKREGQNIPSIVTACIEDVEKRGLEEVGIYRVSASTNDVQRIKKAFDKSKWMCDKTLLLFERSPVTVLSCVIGV